MHYNIVESFETCLKNSAISIRENGTKRKCFEKQISNNVCIFNSRMKRDHVINNKINITDMRFDIASYHIARNPIIAKTI